MGVQAQSALIAAILLLALGINVAFQERRVELRWSFVWLVGAFWFYNLSFFLLDVTHSHVWHRALLVSGIAISVTSVRFFGRYIGRRLGPERRIVQWLAAVAAVIVLTPLAESAVIVAAVALLATGAYAFSHWQLYLSWQASTNPTDKRRLRYLVIGGAISVGTSALDVLPARGIPFPSLGHMFTTVYLYFWMQVIQRSRLLDLREQLGRGLAMLLQASAATLIYLGLVSWAGEKFGLFLYNSFVVGVVLFFVWEPIKRAVDLWVGKLLFRERQGFEQNLRRLNRELTSVISLADLAERLLASLESSRRVTHASLYLLEDEGLAYFRARSFGPMPAERMHMVRDRHFLDALRAARVLVQDRVERELADLIDLADGGRPDERDRLGDIIVTLESMSASLCFALMSGERLLGFLNVRDDRAREAFSSHEIALVAGVARQAATIIENSELFTRLKERERLTIIGEMAAGMAHEIRNPLGAIKAAGQLLAPEDLDEEQREMVEVIIEETDRLNLVLSQFLDYARPYKGRLEPVVLGPLLERAGKLVRTEAEERGIKVSVALESALPPVLGDGDRLLQVFLNLGRNACEAMEAGGTLRLSAGLETSADDAVGRVRVRFRDTGAGISAEVRQNLFIPFFTTKKQGTGLGLAITERILQQHGSRIRVDSEVGVGTEITFSLPVAAGDDTDYTLSGEHRRSLAKPTG